MSLSTTACHVTNRQWCENRDEDAYDVMILGDS
jgi:hypothetical protein